MADISKITLPNGSSYDFKDSVVRAALETKAEKALYGDTGINVGRDADSNTGSHSAALGYRNTASGANSFASGYMNKATAQASNASGYNTEATGLYSKSEGLVTHATNIASHAGGQYSYASGKYSFSHGDHTKSTNSQEASFGKYNKSSSDTLFSVGDGTDENTRHNAFEITKTSGKLHDKDIAVKDDIPTSLPASGGNADTVGGFHANFLLKNIATANNLTTSIDTCYDTGTYSVEAAYTPNFPVGYGNYGFLEIRAYGSIRYQTVRFETGVIINRAIIVGQGSWTSWAELFSPVSKPYVTGTLGEQASSSNVTLTFEIFNFTPSKVICQFGSGSAFFANVITNGFSLTIPAGTTTIHYIAFK